MDTFLELDKVSYTYFSKKGETQALKDITFSVRENEFFGICGPSGSGKTTILSLIAGILTPESGSITLSGEPAIKSQNRIGYMLQKDHLFEWRTVYENVMLGLELQKNKSEPAKNRVLDLLKKYGLYDFKDSHPSALSGGMRQRVALIRTLALSPTILLLDEPFSALDYVTRLSVQSDVYNIIKKEKITTVLISHDISEAISMSDRIAMLSPRPATVKGVFDINIDGKTPLERRNNPAFSKAFEKIWKELE